MSMFFLATLFYTACKEMERKPESDAETYYSAIEFNDVLCGYSAINLSDSLINDKKVNVLRQNTFFNFTVMGKDVTQYHKYTYFIDSSSGNFIYHDSYHKQGNTELGGFVYVENGNIRVTALNGKKDTLLPLPENIVLPNTQFYPYLIHDFSDGKLENKTYQIFEVRTEAIVEITYTRVGEEQLDLAGRHFDAVVLTESNPATGLVTKLWIDKKTAKRLKMESQNHLRMYLAVASVQKRIKTGNWDDVVFIKTNRTIKDIHAISYMKIKGSLESVPAATKGDLPAMVGTTLPFWLNKGFTFNWPAAVEFVLATVLFQSGFFMLQKGFNDSTFSKKIKTQLLVAGNICLVATVLLVLHLNSNLQLNSGVYQHIFLLFGIASFLLGVLFILPPIRRSKNVIGDYICCVGIGMMPVLGACLVQVGDLHRIVYLASFPIIVSTALWLWITRLVSRAEDEEKGRTTIVSLFPSHFAAWYLTLLITIGVYVSMILVIIGRSLLSPFALIAFVSAGLAYRIVHISWLDDKNRMMIAQKLAFRIYLIVAGAIILSSLTGIFGFAII